MTYARSRLWLGISGVGFLVVLSAAALWFDLPHRLLAGLPLPVALAATLGVFVVVLIPFDLLGGFHLPRLHQRSQISATTFAVAWLRGVLAQAVVQGLCVSALVAAGRWGGIRAATACFVGLLLALTALQAPVARLVGGMRARRAQPGDDLPALAAVFEAQDPGFVGGFAGLPGRERLILPAAWLRELPPEVLATELLRRRGALETGARARGVWVAFAWNALGFLALCHLPGASVTEAAGLVQTGLWFTLWSFAGLLILPSLNRPGVFEADRFALRQGATATALTKTISRLDTLQDDEPARSPWVERIFHPIPSVASRVAGLHAAESPRGAWQCARMTLYLSWACFGFLGRAVHCNVGRPELWVLFPGD